MKILIVLLFLFVSSTGYAQGRSVCLSVCAVEKDKCLGLASNSLWPSTPVSPADMAQATGGVPLPYSNSLFPDKEVTRTYVNESKEKCQQDAIRCKLGCRGDE